MHRSRPRPTIRRVHGILAVLLVPALTLLPGICLADGGSRPVPLAEDPAKADRAGALLYRGGLVLTGGEADFGELSDIRVSPDGARFIALSDKGAVVRGRLSHRADGTLSAAADYDLRVLPELGMAPGDVRRRDSEGLAALGDGTWAVSFERDHRIAIYNHEFTRLISTLPRPPGIEQRKDNQGIEALATLADGSIVALAEGASAPGRHDGWRWSGGSWTRFVYAALDPFRPTAAARLPDGDLLVLERRSSWAGGLGARITVVPAAAIAEGVVVEGREIGRIDPPQIMENFEGIDVRAGADGRVFVYLISDDGGSPILRTVLLMFELPPDLVKAGP